MSVLISASLASFGLGYLAGRDQAGQGNGLITEARTTPKGILGEVVASKGGTKYYAPACKGVERIAPENKVWYDSPADARREGYEPADNCEGL
jgi:hypothetical protein